MKRAGPLIYADGVDDVEILDAAGCGDGFGGCELGSDEKVFDAVAGLACHASDASRQFLPSRFEVFRSQFKLAAIVGAFGREGTLR